MRRHATHALPAHPILDTPIRSAIAGLVCLGMVFVTSITLKAQTPLAESVRRVEAFDRTVVPVVKLQVSEESQDQLRADPRTYTECEWSENGGAPLRVAVKLKGAAGSYRDWDDRPSLTVHTARFEADQRVHGMKKFHLNNSVQDETFLSEWLGAVFFQQAGEDVPRVGHVRLWINDRDMGLYVLREGFDTGYLKRRFGDSRGRLYDGGFLQDIDSDLELDSGDASSPKSDLIDLAAACYEPGFEGRLQTIEAQLDMDAFLTFMAMERICGHWDGYTLNQNNYRIYFPSRGKGVFLPHGMDQLFGDPGAGLYDHSRSMIASAVLQSSVWLEQYRTRLQRLYSRLPSKAECTTVIDRMHERLRPTLQAIDPELAEMHQQRIDELKERISQRLDILPELIESVPSPIEFPSETEDGVVSLSLPDWYPVIETEGVEFESADYDGVRCFTIGRSALGDFVGSWRCQNLLARGVYRLTVRIKTDRVIPIPDDFLGGVTARCHTLGRSESCLGSRDWTTLEVPIEIVEDQRMVEWILEIRARHGRLWIDQDSLQLERLGTN